MSVYEVHLSHKHPENNHRSRENLMIVCSDVETAIFEAKKRFPNETLISQVILRSMYCQTVIVAENDSCDTP